MISFVRAGRQKVAAALRLDCTQHVRRAAILACSADDSESIARQYRQDGFVVINNLLTPHEVTDLQNEMISICRGERGTVPGMLSNSDELSIDDYLRRYLCIHFPHKMSSRVLELVKHGPTAQVLQACIGSPNVKCMQTMMFMKGPGKPGQAVHQDEFFIPTRDMSLCASWIALDDVTIENGGLWVIPGSHKHRTLYPMKPHNDDRFDATPAAFGYPYTEDDWVPVPLPKGSGVFFNGYLLHRSLPNVSKTSYRRAFANHYMSAESLLPWNNDGRLPPTKDMRDIVMVSGTDPHGHDPITDVLEPYLRAEQAQKDKSNLCC
eukprot:m.53620 g.53620  ORF g.53620 m.53620 type:complete len:321 (-) comp13574_c0_seq3:81-1043(-)